jgi:hypothetical protein
MSQHSTERNDRLRDAEEVVSNWRPRPRPPVRPLAGPGAKPHFERLPGAWIDEAFAGQRPVPARRGVQRLPLLAARPEEKPDQYERGGNREPEDKDEHDGRGAGSITAAVP